MVRGQSHAIGRPDVEKKKKLMLGNRQSTVPLNIIVTAP